MKTTLITGSSGLIGSEAVGFFAGQANKVIGIDNHSRSYFFGREASTVQNAERLKKKYPNYEQYNYDIRNYSGLEKVFQKYGSDISLIIHAAGQPSHDWAAKEPLTDFAVNANGTLNMLDLTRKYCPKAVFIFTSTNKVYGDSPNTLPLTEKETRWEIDPAHPYSEKGINENMSIDRSKHSLFGVSKLSADVMCQEYGKYFGLNTGIFRAGCVTGPGHAGAEQHGFLSYLVKCAATKTPYTINGYKGKQVRDNIHASDLVNMFSHFYQNPKPGEVYNAGGGRFSNCSMLEAIALCEMITGHKMNITYSDKNREGDHIWYISDVSKFRAHYPKWEQKYNMENIMHELFSGIKG